MSVQDVVDRVAEVLSRAESLFATPADTASSRMTAAVEDASEASRAIGARTDELGGALASAHHDVLDTIARRLDDVRDTDSRLVEHLTRAGQAHASGGSQATDLLAGAEEIPSRLGTTSELPASGLAGLLALRNQIAGMQRLLAEHTGEAARASDDIRGLTYQP
jgi:phosphoenolpyruvate-protein kinase (PTS system EI component)